MRTLTTFFLIAATVFSAKLPIKKTTVIETGSSFETSGVALNPQTKDLVAISDNGKIFIKNRIFKLEKRDYEGITFGENEEIFVAEEGKDSVVELSTERPYKIKTQYKISRKYKDKKVTSKKGDGFESLTFIKETKKHLYFYTSNQSNKLEGKDRSAILLLKLNKKSKKGEIEEYFSMKIQDISGMFYKNNKEIYFISDKNNKLYKTDSKFKKLKKYDLPGEEQEGIAVDGKTIFIGQDSGGILRIDLNEGI